ncbi:MAG: M1 family metallopeptidase [Bacteroidia bacterium]|nr:M1 family metallopeptidase [Bacteroidia bacterium]
MICNKLKKDKRLILSLALFFVVFAGKTQDSYFQQRLAYTMDVRLNDSTHSISAFEKITYVNNSPHTLNFIYFHLWPNAYKNNSTALAKQLLWQGKTDFFFSKPEERGYIDSLDFKVNGEKLKWDYDPEHIDICKVNLNQALKPGDSVVITTPFYVKIPDAKFSRMGHTYQAYYMTQWYPKPAVFDKDGWHQMPYLDQGEFYSEFGTFDVKITLPENYCLAATGDRVDSGEEENFLHKKMEDTRMKLQDSTHKGDNSFPKSSWAYKTVRFVQIWVHDFAWFADKRFYVMKSDVEVPWSKRTVSTWAFFTPANAKLWQKAVNYVGSATVFYSQMLGDYPYRSVTAVDGSIMAGGGMEYPNITVIGPAGSAEELDMVITHEVGHNWFYGILASNERDKPFLDEGMNSFYEMRYMREKYRSKKLGSLFGTDTTFKFFGINKYPLWKYHELSFYSAYRSAKDQAINLKSEEYSEANYGNIVYSKTALVMDYIMDLMGRDAFDVAMQEYYRINRFSHPEPADLFKILSKHAGRDFTDIQKYLFESTARIDYKIKSAKRNEDGTYTIKLKNKSRTPLPVNVYGFKNGKPAGLVWFDGFQKKRTVTFPPAEVDYFKVDGLDRMPDINRANNGIKTKGLFKHARPLKLNLAAAIENQSKTNLNLMPLLGGNYYNGFMAGLAFHNYSIYEKKFDYLLAPMFAFNTKTPVGFAEFNFNFYPKKAFRVISIGAKAKTFAYDYYSTKFINDQFGTSFDNLYLNYYRISPYIEFVIRKKPTSHVSQTISYQNNNLFTDSIDVASYPTITSAGPVKKNVYSFVNQLDYVLSNSRAIDPFTFQFNMQHTASMAKVAAVLNYKFTLSKRYAFDLRVFAGAFIAGSDAERSYYAFRASGYNGWHDYAFDNYYFARNERNGFGFLQFVDKDGALKVWTPLGQTSQWLVAINLKSPRLYKFPVRLFADVATCDGRALLNDKILWDAGVNIVLVNDLIDVYIPLFYNEDIKKTLELNNVDFAHSIRFTFNIHKLVPKKILQNSIF